MPYCLIKTNLEPHVFTDKFLLEFEEFSAQQMKTKASEVRVEPAAGARIRQNGSDEPALVLTLGFIGVDEDDVEQNDVTIRSYTDFLTQKITQLKRDRVVIHLQKPNPRRSGRGGQVFLKRFQRPPVLTSPHLSRNGFSIPQLGLGCMFWDKGYTDSEVTQMIKQAIDIGYRHFDTSPVYQTEPGIGQAIRDKIIDGVITREDVFLVSKLPGYAHRPEHVRKAVESTLQDLGGGFIDLYLIHYPMPYEPTFEFERRFTKAEMFEKLNDQNLPIYNDNDILETWKHLEKCVDDGLIKHLGLSNFNSKQIQRVLDNFRIKPVNLQIESNPLFTNQQLIEYCARNGIAVTAYLPLGVKDTNIGPLYREEVTQIARKHSRTPAQILLRFQIQRHLCVIPRTTKTHRMKENLAVFDFTLDDEDMEILFKLNENKRNFSFKWITGHKDYPFNEPF